MFNYQHRQPDHPDDEFWGWIIAIGVHVVFFTLLWLASPIWATGFICAFYGAALGIGLNCGSHSLCCRTPKPRNFWRD